MNRVFSQLCIYTHLITNMVFEFNNLLDKYNKLYYNNKYFIKATTNKISKSIN